MNISIEKFASLIQCYRYELILLFLAYIIAMTIKKSRSNFPPGPMGLPIVGYLPFLTKDMYLDLINLGKKYGDVFSIKLGSLDIVVLHGSDAVKEAFIKPELLGRPPNNALETMTPSSPFFSSNFELWKEQRKFVVHSMKDLGLGKTKLENDIMDEIQHFMKLLRSEKTNPIDIKKPLTPSISNNICALCFGERFHYNDPDGQLLDKSVDELVGYFSHYPLEVLFPWIIYIPFIKKFLQIGKTSAVVQNGEKLLQKKINEHLKTIDSNDMRDFMDKYLVELHKQVAKNKDTSFNHDVLISSILDLYGPALETVRSSLLWAVYIIAAYPDVQKRVQKEIMEVTGSERTPEYTDVRNMPYTHSVILEIMRWKAVVPLNLMHYAMADTTVGGYKIPKGTTITANLWAIHHDPRNWEEPEKFMPERFLTKDGKSVVKPNYLMLFSLGKRSCPGESMAYMQMFLYFTTLLQEFDIAFPSGTIPTFKGKYAVTYKPEPYLVRFIPKN